MNVKKVAVVGTVTRILATRVALEFAGSVLLLTVHNVVDSADCLAVRFLEKIEEDTDRETKLMLKYAYETFEGIHYKLQGSILHLSRRF